MAIFQYFSDKSLYQLMVMEGSAEVIRNGDIMEVNQTDVVPGDIVRLKVRYSSNVLMHLTLSLLTFYH